MKIGLRPHQCRHTCASHLLEHGFGGQNLKELLGHERLSTTIGYTHITKNQMLNFVNNFHPRNKVRKMAETLKK